MTRRPSNDLTSATPASQSETVVTTKVIADMRPPATIDAAGRALDYTRQNTDQYLLSAGCGIPSPKPPGNPPFRQRAVGALRLFWLRRTPGHGVYRQYDRSDQYYQR